MAFFMKITLLAPGETDETLVFEQHTTDTKQLINAIQNSKNETNSFLTELMVKQGISTDQQSLSGSEMSDNEEDYN